MEMNRDLTIADFLEELSIYGNPRRCYDSETAHCIAQLILNRHLVKMALSPLHLPALHDWSRPKPPPPAIQPETPRPTYAERRRRQDWKVEF